MKNALHKIGSITSDEDDLTPKINKLTKEERAEIANKNFGPKLSKTELEKLTLDKEELTTKDITNIIYSYTGLKSTEDVASIHSMIINPLTDDLNTVKSKESTILDINNAIKNIFDTSAMLNKIKEKVVLNKSEVGNNTPEDEN